MNVEETKERLRLAIEHARARAQEEAEPGRHQFWRGKAHGLEVALRMLGEAAPTGRVQLGETGDTAQEDRGPGRSFPEIDRDTLKRIA